MDNNAHDQLQPDLWECFGVAIDAMRFAGRGVHELLTALEVGRIRARASGERPVTSVKILDDSRLPSPGWWLDYRNACAGNMCVPSKWILWLRDDVKVEQAATLQILSNHFAAERKSFASRRRVQRQDGAWSDLEALAWFATQEVELVAQVRDFAHQEKEWATSARAVGLRFLTFEVASKYCRCGGDRPLLAMLGSKGCACLRAAAGRMIENLGSGRIAALHVDRRGEVESLAAEMFESVDTSLTANWLAPLGTAGELLFDQANVQSALVSKRHRGRPQGSGMKDDRGHLAAMVEWREQNPGKSRRDAARFVEKTANQNGAVQSESFIRRLLSKFSPANSP